MATPRRDLLVIGGTLAGAAAALAGVRSGARTRLLVSGAQDPGPVPPIPDDVTTRVEDAVEASEIPLPEEAQVFRFRARRVRRWLDELDVTNDEAWATNMRQAILERCEREGVAIDEVAVAVRLVKGDQGVSGAVLVDGNQCQVHDADTTVLAGGGARFLWPEAKQASPPVGLALAHRAELPTGDPGAVAWGDDGTPSRFVDGVRGDGRGQCGVAGVAACGQALASPLHADPALAHLEDVVRGLEAGGFQGPTPQPGDPELVPLVDEAMPPGFTQTKLSRLRATIGKLGGPEASQEDLGKLHAEMLSMRGEFADYARARADTDVHLLHQAADVALAFVASRLEGT